MLGTERGLFEKGRFQRQQAFQVLKLAKIGTDSAAPMFVINLDLQNSRILIYHEHCNTLSMTPTGLQELRKYQ